MLNVHNDRHSSRILFTKASLRIEIFFLRASSGLEVLVVSMDISNTNTEMTDDIIINNMAIEEMCIEST